MAHAADELSDVGVSELWWIGTIQGFFALLFGILVLFWPNLTLSTLIYLFSGFVLAVGISEIAFGLFSIERREAWWLSLLMGLVGLGVGVYLVRNTHISLKTFILIAGVTLIARGLLELVKVFIDRIGRINRTLGTIGSIAAVLAGIIILLQPESNGLSFVWVLGLYALVIGPLLMAIAFDLRNQLIDALADGGGDTDETTAIIEEE